MKLAKWRSMDNAPKGKVVLLDVGFPWAVIGIWSDRYQEWVFPYLMVDKVQQALGEEPWDDVYFENEREANPKGWLPLPEVMGSC